MCGILAVIGKIDTIPETETINALNVITHRGPDDYGVEKFRNALLGFRRLSIIDLSAKGHQPMSSGDERYWIIFNGEIYNYLEIKNGLEQNGYSFRSSTDTEVILNGFIHYGETILDMLDGMFSFVVYDRKSGNVFAARDRMGKKPLLYYRNSEVLVFFSELKQITQFSFFEKRINYHAITSFLTYGAIASPMTMFENVHHVEAGHYATFKNGSFSEVQYWKPQININKKISYSDATQKTHDLVTKSITKRLISDVPLGAFLSGGIDSSIITAVMANHSSEVKTFSINYADAPQNYDESYYAGLIVKQYQTKHSTITISPDDVYNDIEKIIWHMDQPSCDAINTYFVSESARKGVTVSLSGVGGDELFAGYSTFKFAETLSLFRSVRNGNRNASTTMDRIFFSLPISFQVDWKIRTIAGVLGAFPTSSSRYNLIKQIYRKEELLRITKNHLHGFFENDSLEQYFDSSWSNIQQITMAEVNNYLINTLLRDSDVMGMAHSLEIRCPFIDHHLIEFALTLPDQFKIKNIGTKIILKDAFRSYLPDEVVSRKKMGFAFPLSVWLKNGKLKEIVEDCLSESSIAKRGIFNYKEVRAIMESYFLLKNTNIQTYQSYQKVWELVVLELWIRQFIDNSRQLK